MYFLNFQNLPIKFAEFLNFLGFLSIFFIFLNFLEYQENIISQNVLENNYSFFEL